jgi:hypothetical protein
LANLGHAAIPSAAREAMEKLNAEAGGLHIWLRTQANAPAQRPWFKDSGTDVGRPLRLERLFVPQIGRQWLLVVNRRWAPRTSTRPRQ